MREERKQNLAKDLERFNKAMKEVQEDSDWEDNNALKGSDAESDYSDWEGLENDNESSVPTGILKKQEYFEAEDEDEEDATVVIESMDDGNSSFTFPEKTLAAFKETLKPKKASDGAEGADGEDTEVTFGGKDHKDKQKKRKFRYLTKTERRSNVSKERGRSKEKRTRAKK